MKRIHLVLCLLALLGLTAGPAAAQCGVDTVCANIPAGASASDIVSIIDDAWDLGDFACQANPADNSQIRVIATNGTRTINYVVPAGTTPQPHSYELRFQLPLGAGNVFDIFVDFDNAGEILVRDGTLEFEDITMVTATPTTSLPMLEPKRALLFVVGLLGVGMAYLLFRRS